MDTGTSQTDIDQALAPIENSAPRELSNAADQMRDKLLSWAQSKLDKDEFIRAKEEFFWKTGKVFYDDTFYETRMEYFIDYFLYERPLSAPFEGNLCLPPEMVFLKHVDNESSDTLGTRFHTLLQVLKVSNHRLIALNLLTSKKMEIIARPFETFRAIGKKEIVQGFVYQYEGEYTLSRGAIFHPLKANRFIKKELKKTKNDSNFEIAGFLATLAKFHLRHLRHAHVDPRRIYTYL